MRWLVFGAVLCVATAPARADSATDGSGSRNTEHSETESLVNLRVGGSSGDRNRRPVICAEVSLSWGVSLEGCGTGSGILHQDSGGEMAHFRANKRLWSRPAGRGSFVTNAGLGLAELEVAQDSFGLDFGSPDGPRGSVAGPEASASARYLAPLGRGFEFIANASVGAAWFDGARELLVPQNKLQVFTSLEIGVGW